MDKPTELDVEVGDQVNITSGAFENFVATITEIDYSKSKIKLFLAVETGIFITAGTLPLIVLVVFFSKTYVFSILQCEPCLFPPLLI